MSITVNDPYHGEAVRRPSSPGPPRRPRSRAGRSAWLTPTANADQANSAIQNFVQRRAVGIIDLVFPTTSLRAGVLAAQKAKIPVATWGSGLGDGVVISDGDGGPFAQPIVDKMLKDMGGREETQFLK